MLVEEPGKSAVETDVYPFLFFSTAMFTILTLH